MVRSPYVPLALALSATALVGCGAPLDDAPPRRATTPTGEVDVAPPPSAAPAVSASATAQPPSLAGTWPISPRGFDGAVGVYWPAGEEPRGQAEGMVVITLDELGHAWMFLRDDGDLRGFVIAVSETSRGWSIEAAAGVELPSALAGARFRVEGTKLVEERASGAPVTRTRDRAKELAMLTPGTTLAAPAPEKGSLRAHGPLLVGAGMGRDADACWVGLVLPMPPSAPDRAKARPGRLVGRWVGDSLEPDEGAACGLAAKAGAKPIEVEGAISDLVLLSDQRGPLALVAVGYMAALVFVPPDRASDPALSRAVEEGLRAAE
jgi:hypothetical protein